MVGFSVASAPFLDGRFALVLIATAGPAEGVAPSPVVVKIGPTASPGARFLSQVEHLTKILVVGGMRGGCFS